jgi:hypothetical protein
MQYRKLAGAHTDWLAFLSVQFLKVSPLDPARCSQAFHDCITPGFIDHRSLNR